MTASIVTNPPRSYDHIDTDVYNMSRWGIDFRDADYRFTDWSTETEGILGYIHMFERMETEPNIGAPEPSPIFWAVWHDTAQNSGIDLDHDSIEVLEATMSRYRLNWDPEYLDSRYVPLADWEYELLGWGEPIAWQTLNRGNYTYHSDLWNLLAGV